MTTRISLSLNGACSPRVTNNFGPDHHVRTAPEIWKVFCITLGGDTPFGIDIEQRDSRSLEGADHDQAEDRLLQHSSEFPDAMEGASALFLLSYNVLKSSGVLVSLVSNY